MLKTARTVYDEEYTAKGGKAIQQEENDESEAGSEDEEDFLQRHLDSVAPGPIKDQFKDYIGGTPVAVKEGGLFSWWSSQTNHSAIMRMAFDYLSIPAMSAETERIFSDTKLYISPLRSRLGIDIVEAMECLLRWNRAGLQEETE